MASHASELPGAVTSLLRRGTVIPAHPLALDASRHGLNLRWQDGLARVSLPLVLAEGGVWQHGLQRIEVDPAAGSLLLKPLIDRPAALPWPSLAGDRSVQIGGQVVWLSQDLLSAWAW